MENILLLLGSLVIILLGAEAFTNSIEWFGKKLNLGEGAVGSVLAAVGTALPETMIPIMAILFTQGEQGSEIGIGAILGAPFMLGTLAFAVTGMAVFIFTLLGKRTTRINVDIGVIRRDLGFFLLVFILATIPAFFPDRLLRIAVASALLFCYFWYVYQTFTHTPEKPKGEEEIDIDLKPLYCCLRSESPSLLLVIFQIIMSLILIVTGAHLFVGGVEHIAQIIHIPPLILALVIAPIATELPEKLNSIIWIRGNKDTLALGNITGAMVFQSAIGPAIGILFTPWVLSSEALLSIVLTLLSVLLVYLLAMKQQKISPYALLSGGAFYGIFLTYLVYSL